MGATISLIISVFIIPSIYLAGGMFLCFCLNLITNEVKGIEFLRKFNYLVPYIKRDVTIYDKLRKRSMYSRIIGLISCGLLTYSIYSRNLLMTGIFVLGFIISWHNPQSEIEDVITIYGDYLLLDKIEDENPNLLFKYKKSKEASSRSNRNSDSLH